MWRSSVVMRRGSSRGGGVVGRSLSRPHVLVQHSGPGMGSHSRGPVHVGSLAKGRVGALHQSLRASRGAERSHRLTRSSLGSDSCSLLRQHHSGVVSPSSGRDLFTGPQRSDSGHPSLGRVAGDFSPPSVCSRYSNVVTDALSCPHQVIGAEWTLHQEVFDMIRKKWPVTIDLFASSLNHRCGVYFAAVSNPMAAGINAMLQSWDHLMVYAFPPFALIPQVLVKLRESQRVSLTLIARSGLRGSGSWVFSISW